MLLSAVGAACAVVAACSSTADGPGSQPGDAPANDSGILGTDDGGPTADGSGIDSGGDGDVGGDSDASHAPDGSSHADASTCGDTLTDPKNCGACGHDCRGSTCAKGLCAPETIVTLKNLGCGLVADDTNLYYLEEPQGSPPSVMRVAKAGGSGPVALGTSDPADMYKCPLMLSGGRVFVTTEDHESFHHEGVRSFLVTGGGPTVVMDEISGSTEIFASTPTAVYRSQCNSLTRFPVPAGPSETIWDSGCSGGAGPYATPLRIDATSTFAYIAGRADGGFTQVLYRIRLDKTGVDYLVPDFSDAFGPIAVTDDRIYYPTRGTCTGSQTYNECTGGGIFAIAIGGGPAVQVARSLGGGGKGGAYTGVYDIQADATSVVWMTYDETSSVRTLVSVPRGGGEPLVLASGLPHGDVQFALDASYVYLWTDGGFPQLVRIAR